MGQADAIVVLGAAVWPGGVASPTLARRVRHAAALYRAGAADRLLLTGGVGRHPPAEAAVMAALAVADSVPPDRLLLEDRAANTFESARNCAALLKAHGWSRALLVSDAYHLRRSILAFRAFGIDAVGSASGGRLEDLGWRRWLYHRSREGVGLVWYSARLAPARLAPQENWPTHPEVRRPSRRENSEQT